MKDELKQASGSMPDRPNILFIMTDQQQARMMSCAGNQWLKTPAMDSLAGTGTRFELAYTPDPVCMPSRTCMVTGRYCSDFGFLSNDDGGDAVIPEETREQTMGKLLRCSGYETVFAGKTHWAKGLDYETCGFTNLTSDERDELATACADYLREKHDKPFLLVASFINPHDICYVELDRCAEFYGIDGWGGNTIERRMVRWAEDLAEQAKRDGTFDRVCPPLAANHAVPENEPSALMMRTVDEPDPDKPRASDAYYYFRHYVRDEWTEEDWRMHHWIYHRLTEHVDAQIGRVLDALRESGRDRDTIVVFTSDHGDMDGSHKGIHKDWFYDESARVPFIVSGPGVGRGVDREHLVSASLDLIPTFCGVAGAPVPLGLPGRSLKPILREERVAEWRESVVSESRYGWMIRTEGFKYCLYKSGEPRESLVDMKNDPHEMVNLIDDPAHAGILDRHREMLARETGADGKGTHNAS